MSNIGDILVEDGTQMQITDIQIIDNVDNNGSTLTITSVQLLE